MRVLALALVMALISPLVKASDEGAIAKTVRWTAPSLSRFINKKIDATAEAGNITLQEAEVLKDEPELLTLLPKIHCRAIVISQFVCGIPVEEQSLDAFNDEETDAIRHFIFSALLTEYFGKQTALRYTNAHEGVEGVHGKLDPRREMDLWNNRVGIEWMSKFGRRLTSRSNVRLAKGALQALQDDKLVTVKSGENRCADKSFQLKGANLAGQIREYKFAMKPHRPTVCMGLKETFESY